MSLYMGIYYVPLFVLCVSKWLSNCTVGGFAGPMPALSRGHTEGMRPTKARLSLKRILSVAGLSLIYGVRQWLAGGTGGARAPSLSQPQVMG